MNVPCTLPSGAMFAICGTWKRAWQNDQAYTTLAGGTELGLIWTGLVRLWKRTDSYQWYRLDRPNQWKRTYPV